MKNAKYWVKSTCYQPGGSVKEIKVPFAIFPTVNVGKEVIFKWLELRRKEGGKIEISAYHGLLAVIPPAAVAPQYNPGVLKRTL